MERRFIILTLFFVLFLPFVSHTMELTPEEKDFLRSSETIKVCVDPDWYPFEQIDSNGKYIGIGADLFALIAERTGLQYEIYNTSSWDVSLMASKTGKCDVLSFLNKTPQRDEWLLFTEPHFTDVNVFITRNEHKFISDPSQLYDETIVFPKGTSMEERVRMNYPNLRVVITESEKDAFDMVENKEADMTMRSLLVAGYTIREEGYFNLKIAGQMPDYKNVFRIGVVKDKPILVDILNKGIMSLTNQDRELIVNKYTNINIEKKHISIYKTVAAMVLISLALISLHLYRTATLKSRIKALTVKEDDTGIITTDKMSEVLDYEIKKAKRYSRPLSVALVRFDDASGSGIFDAEHFTKAMKSSFGTLRSSDFVGRWGRDELLVVFTETDIKGAALAFERIYKILADYIKKNGLSTSIYFGMSEFSNTDDMNTLLSRADTVLFMSKDTENI